MRDPVHSDALQEIPPLKSSRPLRPRWWKDANFLVATAYPLSIEDAHLLKVSAVLPQAIAAHLTFLDAISADGSEVPNSYVYLPAPHAHLNFRAANSTSVEIVVDSL